MIPIALFKKILGYQFIPGIEVSNIKVIFKEMNIFYDSLAEAIIFM